MCECEFNIRTSGAARRATALDGARMAALLVLALIAGAGATWWWQAHNVRVPLYSDGLAQGLDGSRFLLPPHSDARFISGTRVTAPPPTADSLSRARAHNAAAAQRRWLASGTVPGANTRWADMTRGALLDLRGLQSAENGGVLAAASEKWRYVWPRDASFAAAAFARTGHKQEALRILLFLQRVQGKDGWFQARYLPDGSGPPDSRGIQTDGTGWALWAAAELIDATQSDPARREVFETLQPMIDRSSTAIIAAIDNANHFPPPSSDYWEVKQDNLTLGASAPLLAGLEAAARTYSHVDKTANASVARSSAQRLHAAITETFGAEGYPRELGEDNRDAAVAFMLPPFQPYSDPAVLDAWSQAAEDMVRPAGGLAPGASWKNDGISWTPETAVFALTAAANGRTGSAASWLDWLDAHRTKAGALPEKVLSNGEPAAVAPLAWTAASVVLAVHILDERLQEGEPPLHSR